MSTELQSIANNPGSGSAGTIAATLGAPVTAGSLLIAEISYDLGAGNTNAITDVSDGLGNVFTLIAEVRDITQGQGLAMYYKRQANAGSSTVTVTFSASAAFRRLIVAEFSTTTDVLDTFNTQPRTATNTSTDGLTCAAHTPNAANALIVACVEVHASTPTTTIAPGTNYTEADETAVNSGANMELEYRDKSGAGAEQSTWTHTTAAASNYIAISAAFIASSGGAMRDADWLSAVGW